jgi:hypothetical protein
MNLVGRQALYKAIEDYRKKPLIVFATSTRPNVGGTMAADSVREFIDQIQSIPDAGKAVDVLIHSNGGDPLAAWKLMSLIRERFTNVSVLVPYTAFSAATLFALGGDEIVMHPNASLGPIDPQIFMKQADGSTKHFAYEDVAAFLRFLATEVRITEQAHVSAVIDKLFSVVDPVNIGAAKRASELSSSIGERLLLTHNEQPKDKAQARITAENLNKSFFAHGDAVSRKRAKELQLEIAPEDVKLEKLIWDAYLGIEAYMELRDPFIPLQQFLADPAGAAALQPVAPLNIPPNTPPQFAQNAWNAVLNQATQNALNASVLVPYSVVNAIIESTRLASEFRTTGSLTASRTANGEIQVSGIDTDTRWRPVAAPEIVPLPTQVAGVTDAAPQPVASPSAAPGAQASNP